jgi:hypothetical protein
MPTTATEIDVRIETATLRRDLDAARATIKRLNALLVTYERERDEYASQLARLYATIDRMTTELAELRELNADRERDLAFEYAGRLKAEATIDRLKDELAAARANALPC